MLDELDMPVQCKIEYQYVGSSTVFTNQSYPNLREALKAYREKVPNKGRLYFARVRAIENGAVLRTI